MRKLMYNFSKICLFLFFVFVSCGKKDDDEKISKFKNVIEKNLDKKLFVPSDLETYFPFNHNPLDSLQLSKSNLKLYTRINASCSACIDGIKNWQKFSNEIKNYKVSIILVCSSTDNFELLKYLCENGKIKDFSYPFYLDKKDDYFLKNSFMKVSPEFETVLTDSDNKILLIGNPTHSNETKQLYCQEIAKKSKKK